MTNPVSLIDDFVKHTFREHNKEADHWANVGAEGQRKTVIDRNSDADTWKASKGFWDGSCKESGKSGCGVVIKGFAREEWVTNSKIAVPHKVETAMAAEMMGVCVRTGTLDLIFNKCLCVPNVDKCIDKVLAKQ